MKPPNSRSTKLLNRLVILISTSIIIVTSSTYIGLRIWFKSEINQICTVAIQQYGGDKIEALIAVLNSENEALETKNRAIWALGKLRDKRVLRKPV